MAQEPTICLKGLNGQSLDQFWELVQIGRIGRLDSLDVVLEDNSVSRHHAELRATDLGWRLVDLGSTNGTFLNGQKLSQGQWPVRAKDIVKCGDVILKIESLTHPKQDLLENDGSGTDIICVESVQSLAWDGAIRQVTGQITDSPTTQKQLLALFRAGSHLVRLGNETELLRNILEDAVQTLDAQRGAIVLAEGDPVKLSVKAISEGRKPPSRSGESSRTAYSQSLARRCFDSGESVLCRKVEDDPFLASAQSVAEGMMTSVICALLRTPRVKLGILHLDRGPGQKPFTSEDHLLADALAAQVSVGIEAALLLKKQRTRFLEVIQALAQIIEVRDDYTGNHTRRVTRYAELLGKAYGLSSEQMDLISLGTPLHDIGKIGVDDAVLRKAGRLTEEEYTKMKAHTVIGGQIIGSIPDLASILPIVRNHHERFDGTGYPDQLMGNEIPVLARLVSVADAFDAMTSDRPYRPAYGVERAFNELERLAGSQFDPKLVQVFLSIRPKIEIEWAKHHGGG